MIINGKITGILPVLTGTTESGKEWKKQTVVVEEKDGDFSNSIAITFFGEDGVQKASVLSVGDRVEITAKVSSREFGNSWFTDVTLRTLKVFKEKVV